MFRLWGKLVKNNKIIEDIVVTNESSDMSLEDMVDIAIDEMCMKFDLSKPMWLNDNYKDFHDFSKTSFKQSHFIEQINFDYFEIELI
jgi:hypothetical protein